MLEVEVKIKIEKNNIEKQLISLGFTKGSSVYELDTYFNSDNMDLKSADKALRIREHKDMSTGEVNYILNFKGPKVDDVTMTRQETQFKIPSFGDGKLVLNGLGFYAAGNVEKTRVHYKKEAITCCVDSVTGLGDFLEIEIMAEEKDYDDAIHKIGKLLEKLGLSMGDTINSSYLCMLN